MSQNTQAAAATKSKFSVRDICYAGLFAAVIAVMAQISIPMPLGVPMTMQTFAITLAAVVLGSKLSAIASLVYLALGAVGVPVLANFSGGFDKFVGPTGGFLISFPLMAYIIGLGVEHRDSFKGRFRHRCHRRHGGQLCGGRCNVRGRRPQHHRRGYHRLRPALHPHCHHQGSSGLRHRPESAEAHSGAESMSIVLRPHHLLCTQGYSGKGYDNDFVAHMTDVVHQLRDVPGTTIHLTFSTDTLCSCCPNKLGEDLCDTQEKVKRYDAKTVEYFGLEEKEYVYQDLIRAIDAKATPEILADICRDCCWFPISACCKNICEGRYVK